MFEQSLVVSQVGRVSAESRWTWAGSIVLQGCAAALLIVFPMLHPERMVFSLAAPRAYVPLRAAKLQEVKVKHVEAASSAVQVSAVLASGPRAMTMPALIPHGISAGDPPAMSATGGMEGMGDGLPAEVAEAGPAARVGVAVSGARTEARGPVRVSSGVGAGMLMAPIRPVYPQIARAAHVEGAVVVEAVISPLGRIERAHVVSGPAMLAGAALDAVQAARYVPYRLNGTATEVETTITVNFRMG